MREFQVHSRRFRLPVKVQGLNENRDSFRTPRRDYASGDANRRPQPDSRRDDGPRNRGNNVHVRSVRKQIDVNQIAVNDARIAKKPGILWTKKGRAEGNNPGQLNPNAQDFNSHVETTPVNLDRNGRSESNEARTLN